MGDKQAILLLTNRQDKNLLDLYRELMINIGPDDDIFLLYHQTKPRLPKRILRCNHFLFSYDSLSQLNYTPIAATLIPGSNHFPVLSFFIDNPGYKYYWCIEDDVRFNGSWKYFFEITGQYDNDFFSSHLKRFQDDPSWFWWNIIGHPDKSLPVSSKVKSFNPIYRISGPALKYIDECLKNHWFGHHEVLIPTLLNDRGFKIADLGGGDEFAQAGMTTRFYTDENLESAQVQSTVRWRPVMDKAGIIPDKLYHPVKDIRPINKPI